MTPTNPEPRNPLYLLLLLAGTIFTINAVAYAVVPVLEEKAADAGNPPPPSTLRDALRRDGPRWLLIELGVVALLSLGCMVVDRRRSLQRERAQGTIETKDGGPAPS